MKNNEKGFTYPLTLCLLIIFLLFVTSRMELLVRERQISNETKTFLKKEYYLLAAVKKSERILQSGESFQNSGIYQFQTGKVSWIQETQTGGGFKITFNLLMDSGETSVGVATYDYVAKKMIKWVEK